MVLERDTGFFVKLYSDEPDMNINPKYSDSLVQIINWAQQTGHRMIEFDGDADAHSEFMTHSW